MNMNTASFNPEEVKAGLLQKLLDYLFEFNNKSKDRSYDIHITTDGYCVIVEWCEKADNGEYGGHFEFIDDDNGEEVYKPVILPDNSTMYISKYRDDVDEIINDWKEENHWSEDEESEFSKSVKAVLRGE